MRKENDKLIRRENPKDNIENIQLAGIQNNDWIV